MKIHKPAIFFISLTLWSIISIYPTSTRAADQPLLRFSSSYNLFNPASRFTGSQDLPSTIFSTILPFALILAGLLLLLMLIAGGFTMLTNPTNPQAQESGKARITWAFVGFFVLFLSYWIMQILQVVFGIRVVS